MAILANPCQLSRIGQWGRTRSNGQCMASGMCWPKRQPKLTCHDEVGCAIVRAAAACFVVIVCLLYDSQVLEYNTPTIPKPCETSPHFFEMNKQSPMAGEHSRIDYSLRRSFHRSEEWQEIRIGFQSLGEISWILGTLVHTSMLDNVSIFKVGYLCTLPKNSFWVCTVQYCSTQDENQSANCDERRLIEVA